MEPEAVYAHAREFTYPFYSLLTIVYRLRRSTGSRCERVNIITETVQQIHFLGPTKRRKTPKIERVLIG